MLDNKQMKAHGVRYARSLQACVKTAMAFSVEHPACDAPLRQSFDALNALLKETGQFTLGFVDRQVVLNKLLTSDPTLVRLENELLKRGIGAVTFEVGVTLALYKQAVALLSTPVHAIEQCGGLRPFLEQRPMEKVRVLIAPRNQKRTEEGDTVLETDSESYILSRQVDDPRPHDLLESLNTLWESAGLDAPARTALIAEVEEQGIISEYTGLRRTGGQPAGGQGGHGGAEEEGSGGGGGPGRGSGGPWGYKSFMEMVSDSVERALVDPNGAPEQSYVALARILRDTNLDTVLSHFPEQRQSELRALPPEQLAAELIEDTALRWAGKRLSVNAGQGDNLLVEEEVVRVLVRSLRATQTADRLAAKLAKYVQDYALPKNICERIQDELKWDALLSTQKHKRLLETQRFSAIQFHRLLEHIGHLLEERGVAQATEVALHYFEFLQLPGNQILPEELSRAPELVRLMAVARSEFMPQVVERLGKALQRQDVNEFVHFQVANCLMVISQSLAVYEDFPRVQVIGALLERVRASDPESHKLCCTKALKNLLPPTAVERLIELYLVQRDEDWLKTVSALLRWVGSAAIDQAFRRMEEEASGKNRMALVRLLSHTGEEGIEAALQRMADPRWYVVRNTCLVLAELKDPELAEHLAPALKHGNDRVQETAASALIKHHSANRGKVFAEALPHLRLNVLEKVLEELVFLKDPATLPALEEFILRYRHSSVQTTRKALQVVGGIPTLSGLEALGRILSHTKLDATTRGQALVALARSSSAYSRVLIADFAARVPEDPLAQECERLLGTAGQADAEKEEIENSAQDKKG